MNFDSTYEKWFYHWCEELKDLGYIEEFEQQIPFILFEEFSVKRTKELKNKEKIDTKCLFKPCTYTTDFRIIWTEKGLNSSLVSNLFDYKDTPIIEQDGVSYIEIKPVYDYKNSKQRTNILIKWLFQLEHVYINTIVPVGSSTCLFNKTFTPKEYSVTETGKPRKLKYEIKLIEEWHTNESATIAELK